jgi:peptide/nickel transport system substrate-binding protein
MTFSLTRRAALSLVSASLAAPAIAKGRNRPVRFVPFADLTILDPIVTTTYVTRNHGFLVYHTLYGLDSTYRVQPQMAEGHTVEDDGRLVSIKLRDGLKFHDGARVTARDCAASIRRWAVRDPLGQTLLKRAANGGDGIRACDDRTIEIRLTRPFPLLFDALGKISPPVCFMMPERFAVTDPFTPIHEVVGSGPFRFLVDERISGSRASYARFDAYVPRPSGQPGGSAGPKNAYIDRVEWLTMSDTSTAAAALQAGEVDWWEWPTFDLLPQLRRSPNIHVWNPDLSGFFPFLRFNALQPPFDDPAKRRALLPAIMQSDYLQALVGDNRDLWQDSIGFFPPGTAMASDEGLSSITGPRSYAEARRALIAAGYRGEPVTLIGATDLLPVRALTEVAADMLKQSGVNVDLQMSDWGTVVTRRANKGAPSQGGWNLLLTYFSGLDFLNPAVHLLLRGNGVAGWPGWPTSPAIEQMRDLWLDAPDEPSRQAIARREQDQAFQDLPYIPVGKFIQPTAHRKDLLGMVSGLSAFWNLKFEP